jgi:pyruvate,water dikinase
MGQEVSSPYILRFEECDLSFLPLVGGKNASLGELIRAGIPVPPGYAITTEAYDVFLNQQGLKKPIFDRLRGLDPQDIAEVGEASHFVRSLIESTPIPEEIATAIGDTYNQFWLELQLPLMPVAVRSSATAEDLPGASFAGQQETYLFVRTQEEILDKVRLCWSSLFTPRAITYRLKMGFDHEKVLISVGVQKMVNSFTAGVMFTLNPASGDVSVIVIDANWGVGESVVSGSVTPDQFVVDKINLEILKKTISRKEMYFTTNAERNKLVEMEVEEERKEVQSVIDKDIRELARFGKLIEAHYGKQMDIEWAVDKDLPAGGNVRILQARPETVWSQKKVEPVVQPRATAMEHIVAGLMQGKKF